LTLRASPNRGAAFLGWLGLSNHVETSELKITLEQSTVLIAVFSGGDTSLFGDIVHLSKPEVLTNLFGFEVAANQTNALVVESSMDLKQWRKLTNTGPEIVVERAEYRQFFRARKE